MDEGELTEKTIETLSVMEKVPKARVVNRTAKINDENAGISVSGEYERTQNIDTDAHRLPNFLRTIDDECFLSRRSAVEILTKSGRTQDFLNNPQRMTEMFIEAVRRVRKRLQG